MHRRCFVFWLSLSLYNVLSKLAGLCILLSYQCMCQKKNGAVHMAHLVIEVIWQTRGARYKYRVLVTARVGSWQVSVAWLRWVEFLLCSSCGYYGNCIRNENLNKVEELHWPWDHVMMKWKWINVVYYVSGLVMILVR